MFYRHRTVSRVHSALVLLLAVSLLAATPAMAESPPPPPPAGTGPYGMQMSDWQALSCLGGGVAGAGALFYYSDILTAPATGAIHPLLMLPTIVAGFLGGCSLTSSISPAFVWIYRRFQGIPIQR